MDHYYIPLQQSNDIIMVGHSSGKIAYNSIDSVEEWTITSKLKTFLKATTKDW